VCDRARVSVRLSQWAARFRVERADAKATELPAIPANPWVSV